ncbi:Predicted ATP-dependent endonuclease of the OLD family, contains P-loop ATPase and TOPRIM domains [Micromonospora matsumotoense]|uniref:Predicted ATP-dependent endonuclease of the OLD family, contains P-loop ATPase and TOPRIM domains n=1 Tax=Micromonospora matsumotoense TaxID=121616 RepID=A0A1C4Y619_9ACTN|nr:TOPRIM nucleotidyl transferase/hydrolase domain-containing protein [Micromonospora matsumotoense]SCF16144.1 Predicted ATP-dependent endonuclease of the OLD family, contains P-loop ATPase and TOPRIM domains [Micromonospora matsumotoense]
MQLVSISVCGFRSLQDVGPIPVRRPTILTGPNDSGKSATISALAFLLGAHPLTDEDRTFATASGGDGTAGREVDDHDPVERVETTWVEGEFRLSKKEEADFSLPGTVRIRRIRDQESGVRLELLVDAPEDENLRNLEARPLADLKRIAGGFGVTASADARSKSSWVTALDQFAATRPRTQAWVSVSKQARAALPKFLLFGDAESAEAAIRAALNTRYRSHLEDEDLKQRVRDLEAELGRRVREDAQGLVEHIQQRCPDLVRVDVEPDVSFTSGLRSTKLLLARTNGETVSLGTVGAGRNRRISLAVWEWASELLRRDAESHPAADDQQHVVLAYDEPDTHLDYLQQRRVMALIREQCSVPGISMVIATHSMNLIDGAAIEDIVHLRLEGERTRINRLLSDLDNDANGQYLADIAIALGLRNTVLLHERCFVGVEGVTEQLSFPLLFRLSTGRPVHAAGIVIVGCHNNEGALKFVGYLARSGRQVMLIIDADSRKNNKIFSDANLAKEGIDIVNHVRFVGTPNKEFEFIFTNDQWCDVANVVWPRNDGEPWGPEAVESLRAGKFSTSLLNLFKEGSDSGPISKASMMYEMTRSLKSAADVPAELRDAFLQLEKLAALDS